MSTLFTFGCSHTESYETTSIVEEYKNYFEYRGGNYPEVWATILAKKLNFDVKNYGWSSSTNLEILKKVFNHINEVKKDDIVIIQWSYAHRFNWIELDKNRWQKMGVNYKFDFIHNQTYMDVIEQITHPLYCSLIYDNEPILEYIAKLIGFKIYYWSVEYEIIHNLPDDLKNNKKYLIPSKFNNNQPFKGSLDVIIENGGEFIYDETNFTVNDCHLGEKGHKVQAELFYKHIKENSNE